MARTARQRAASRRNLIAARKKRHRRNVAFATVAVGTIGLGAASYGAVTKSRKTRPGRTLRKQLSAPPQLAITSGKKVITARSRLRPHGAEFWPQKPTKGKRIFKVGGDYNRAVVEIKRPRIEYDAKRRATYVPKPRKKPASPTARQRQIRNQFDTMNGQKLWRQKNVKGILGNQSKGK